MISVPTVGETEDKGTLQHDVYKNYYEKIFVLVVYDTKGIDGKWKPTEFDVAKENMIKLAYNKASRVFNFDEGKLAEFIKNEPGLGKIKVAECDQTSIPDACRKVQDKCQMKLTWQFRAQFEQTCVERGIELKKLEVIDCNEDECNCLIIYIDIYITDETCACGKNVTYTAKAYVDPSRCPKTYTKECSCSKHHQEEEEKELPVLLIALGSVIGVVFLVALVAFVVFYVRRKKRIQQTGNSMSTMTTMSMMSNMSRSTMNRSSMMSTYREQLKPKPKSKEKAKPEHTPKEKPKHTHVEKPKPKPRSPTSEPPKKPMRKKHKH